MEEELDKIVSKLNELMDKYNPQPEKVQNNVYSEADLYEFEFQFMPAVAAAEWDNPMSKDAFLCNANKIFSTALEHGIIIDSDKFTVVCYPVEDVQIYLYTFPAPPRPPFALYGVIIWGANGTKYYTLERAVDGYMLCSPCVDAHFNYGSVDSPDEDEFVSLAYNHYNGVGIDSNEFELSDDEESVVP